MEAQGFSFCDPGSRSFYSGKKAIKSVADTNGMKIRVQQSDMWVAMMQAIGANAMPLPYAEVYTALKTGVVDAARGAGLPQAHLGRALQGGADRDPRRRQGVGALHAQAVGRAIGGISVEQVMRTIWPFYGALIVALLLVTYVPVFSLGLLRLFFGGKF